MWDGHVSPREAVRALRPCPNHVIPFPVDVRDTLGGHLSISLTSEMGRLYEVTAMA